MLSCCLFQIDPTIRMLQLSGLWSSAAVAHFIQASTYCAFRDGILHSLVVTSGYLSYWRRKSGVWWETGDRCREKTAGKWKRTVKWHERCGSVIYQIKQWSDVNDFIVNNIYIIHLTLDCPLTLLTSDWTTCCHLDRRRWVRWRPSQRAIVSLKTHSVDTMCEWLVIRSDGSVVVTIEADDVHYSVGSASSLTHLMKSNLMPKLFQSHTMTKNKGSCSLNVFRQ